MLIPAYYNSLETDTLKRKKRYPFKHFVLELSVLCITQDLQGHSDKQKKTRKQVFPFSSMRECFKLQHFVFVPICLGKLAYSIPKKHVGQRDTETGQ